jgi:hypothetical protein
VPPVALDQLVRDARRDALSVKVGLLVFKARSAIGYRLRVTGRALRRLR